MKKISDTLDRVAESEFATGIREGMVRVIPVIILGSFALMIQNIPYTPWTEFLAGPSGLWFKNALEFLQFASYGMLSIYVTMSVSHSYTLQLKKGDADTTYEVGCALVVFFVLIGAVSTAEFDAGNLGTGGMFTAFLSAGFGPYLYRKIADRMNIGKGNFAGRSETGPEIFRSIFR
ncbi:MAG: PTS transporter subunit EIIC, partial [Eubacterium sp.]|nr:PTS transporter subunit EIIC [Eubacterium sp.]